MAISGKQEIARRQSAFCLLGSIALMVWLLWQGGGLANGGTVSVSMVVAGSSPRISSLGACPSAGGPATFSRLASFAKASRPARAASGTTYKFVHLSKCDGSRSDDVQTSHTH